MTPLPDHAVRLTLSDGSEVVREIADLLWGPIFEEIRREDAAFRAVDVRHGTLVWPNGADIDPDVLIWGGPARSRGRPPARLRVHVPT